jgi:hypothetical protein
MRHLHMTRSLFALAFVAITAAPAFAGPPLVCAPYDIGTARSLPWEAQGNAWKGMRADYPLSQLAGDTLALLTPTTPVIVRMETLRRGALYATRDPQAARALLAALIDRAKKNGADALATFDAGYLVETYKQLAPIAPETAELAAGIDGYAMVTRARAARGHDPAMEFAAAIVTMDGHRAAWAEHVRVARAGARTDQLLARNIGQLER